MCRRDGERENNKLLRRRSKSVNEKSAIDAPHMMTDAILSEESAVSMSDGGCGCCVRTESSEAGSLSPDLPQAKMVQRIWSSESANMLE